MLTPEAVREQAVREARDFYLSQEGFLDFVRDFGAAPDAEVVPHGRAARSILNWKGEPDPENPEVINYLYKMVLWPRGSFKSTVFDIGQCAWLIANDPDIRILVCSETGKQARGFTNKTMDLISSPRFEEVFGVHKDPKRWSRTNGFVSAQRKAEHKKEPTLLGTGVGEVRTGMHWDIVIMDDVVSQENTKTPEAIETTWAWFGEILAQLDPGCKLLMIGTLHHFSDLYCQIQKNPEVRKLFEFSIHGWKNPDGSLFFPGRLTTEFVRRQKAMMPSRQFACFYENQPRTSDQQIFLPDYFHVIEDHDIPSNCWTYILTDFAFVGGQKGKDQNDRTCFWVVSLDSNRYGYVRDFYVGRWKPSDSVKLVCQLWDRWSQELHMKGITVEDTTHKELLQGLFEEIRRETMTRPKIIPIGGRSQEIKDMRIEGIEPRFREGRIYFARHLREQHRKWNAMIDEMTAWPFTSHDDIPDAVSDLDKQDKKNKWYCPGPPHGWRAASTHLRRPGMVDGKYNPEISWDPRKLLRRDQQSSKGGDLWRSQESDRAGNSLFRRPPQQPKRWPGL